MEYELGLRLDQLIANQEVIVKNQQAIMEGLKKLMEAAQIPVSEAKKRGKDADTK